MKTNLLLLLILSFTFKEASSQYIFGLKAGVNLAHQTYTGGIYSNTYKTKSLLGYRVGVFYKTKIVNQVWLSTAANFAAIGAKQLYNIPTENPADRYIDDRVGYLEIPALIQYDIKSYYIAAGPSVSFKLYEHPGLARSRLDYNSNDLAGVLAVGYHFSKHWDFNIDYSHGLANIYNKSAGRIRRNNYYNLSFLLLF